MCSRRRKVEDENELVYSKDNCGKRHEFEPSQEKGKSSSDLFVIKSDNEYSLL